MVGAILVRERAFQQNQNNQQVIGNYFSILRYTEEDIFNVDLSVLGIGSLR
jgi:hypothetical protein